MSTPVNLISLAPNRTTVQKPGPGSQFESREQVLTVMTGSLCKWITHKKPCVLIYPYAGNNGTGNLIATVLFLDEPHNELYVLSPDSKSFLESPYAPGYDDSDWGRYVFSFDSAHQIYTYIGFFELWTHKPFDDPDYPGYYNWEFKEW